MKTYAIILHTSVNSADIVTRIKTLDNYALYDNAYFVKTDKQTAKEVYDYIVGDPSENVLMVVVEVDPDNKWGYTNKDFWSWLGKKEELS